MATIYDSQGTSALNEKQYINKLYDTSVGAQKGAVEDGYKKSIMQLNDSQKNTMGQTQEYLKRAYAEGGRAAGNMKTSSGIGGAVVSGMGAGANAQARLTLGNQNQANTTALSQQQAAADAEYNRQRQVKSDWYTAQIKKAQADNDMNRAQALYDAAKAEEEQLRSLRQSGAELLAGRGDNSLIDAIGRGDAVQVDETTPTWDGVLKNEEAINKIYDAQLEGQRIAAQADMDKSLSDIDANQQASRREMDKSLTAAYVGALRKGRNYQEVQNAYGQGSGTAAQARLARESELIKKLTDIRTLQIGKDAQTEGARLDAAGTYADAIAKATADTNLARNQALYDAAEQEEQNIVADQQFVGDQLAKKNDYSVLGKLYGLTDEQIALLSGGTGNRRSASWDRLLRSRQNNGGNGGGSGGGTGIAGTANPSIIPLGYGPVSNKTLNSLVSSGKVNANTNSGGGINYSKNPGSSAGITVKLANAGKPVNTAKNLKKNK